MKNSKYSSEELESLKQFVEFVENNDSSSTLVCWGNHSEYSKGY